MNTFFRNYQPSPIVQEIITSYDLDSSEDEDYDSEDEDYDSEDEDYDSEDESEEEDYIGDEDDYYDNLEFTPLEDDEDY